MEDTPYCLKPPYALALRLPALRQLPLRRGSHLAYRPAGRRPGGGYRGQAVPHEGASRLVDGCSYQFDAAKPELPVTLGFDPKDATYPGLKQGEQVLSLKT